MIGDRLDGAVLGLLVGGGAALLLGVVGIFDQPLAERIWLYLLLAGAGSPFLAVVAVEVIIRAKNSSVQRRLDEARAWAGELANQRDELAIRAALSEPVTLLPAAEPIPALDDDDWWPALYAWFTNGHRAGGYSDGRIGPLQSEEAWTQLTQFYASAAGAFVLRLEPGSVGYVLNYPTWSHTAIMREIGTHRLPHPKGAAPDVDAIGLDAARRGVRRAAESGAGVEREGVAA